MTWTKRATCVMLSGVLLMQTACGTLLYPERRGQESGKIDPTVAILNGIGLLLFIVPGLIAFAVDFSTGAIYLPPGEAAGDDDDATRVIYMDPDEITPATLAAAIQEHTGKQVTLTERDIEVMRFGQGDIAQHLRDAETTQQ
ncbi:MAG: hypothetical protein WD009_03845 [Phycisphaeraceae bacterium]